MNRRAILGLTLFTLLLVMAGGALRMVYSQASQIAARGIVVKAFSPANINYTSRINTNIEYCGRTIKTEATVYHRGRDEKIEYRTPNGRTGWSIKQDSHTYAYIPRENKVLISESGQILSDSDRMLTMLQNYTPRYGGTDKVAGRAVFIVSLQPREDGRPAKKLWVDRKYYTILKSVDYAANGDERGSTETTHIDYGAKIDDSRFALPTDKSLNRVMICTSGKSPSVFDAAKVKVKMPKYLPAGYKLEGYHLFNSQCPCDHRTAQITYTDGLNIISVFESPIMTSCSAGTCDMRECKTSNGCAVSGCEMAKTGQVNRKDKTVVVVGDLLPSEVTKIAESVD